MTNDNWTSQVSFGKFSVKPSVQKGAQMIDVNAVVHDVSAGDMVRTSVSISPAVGGSPSQSCPFRSDQTVEEGQLGRKNCSD